MDILFLIGIAIFFGLSGGKIFQKLKIPQVVGYITIGILLGESFFDLLKIDLIEILTPFNNFALGIIGFMIGAELKKNMFKKYGKKFIIILFCQVFMTFFLVAAAVTLFTGKLYLGILLGALASATAPATTMDVLWEYKSKGKLTNTILALVALDDAFALLLYGFAVVFAKTLITGSEFAFVGSIIHPVIEIVAAISIGLLNGYFLYRIIQKIEQKEQLLVLSIGAILLNTGLANLLHIDLILANMAMGLVLTNLSPLKSSLTFEVVRGFSPPIYVLFFVLAGARLQISLLSALGYVGTLYIVMRITGKLLGSYIGAICAKTDPIVKRYLGVTLFSQAGIAIGLAISIYQSFDKLGPVGQEVGLYIINIIAATTFVFEIIGPSCVKFGITKAGEVGKDISEEDLLEKYSVRDLTKKNIESIKNHKRLKEAVMIMKTSAHSVFPVTNNEEEFLGIISFRYLQKVLKKDIDNLLSVGDIVAKDLHITYSSESLKVAMEKFKLETLNYLPVLESKDTRKFVGILTKEKIVELIKQESIGKLLTNSKQKIYQLLNEKSVNLELESEDRNDAIQESVDRKRDTNNDRSRERSCHSPYQNRECIGTSYWIWPIWQGD